MGNPPLDEDGYLGPELEAELPRELQRWGDEESAEPEEECPEALTRRHCDVPGLQIQRNCDLSE
jgi:hypothetical protein